MANQTNRILWMALTGALVLYALIAFLVVPQLGTENEASSILFTVFGVVALSSAGFSLFFRRSALVGPIQAGEVDPETPEGSQKLRGPFLITLALSESVGIMGLVLAILSGSTNVALPFIVAALLLMFIHRPTAPDLISPGNARR